MVINEELYGTTSNGFRYDAIYLFHQQTYFVHGCSIPVIHDLDKKSIKLYRIDCTFEIVNFRQQKSESTFYYSTAKVASSIFIKEKKLSVSKKFNLRSSIL